MITTTSKRHFALMVKRYIKYHLKWLEEMGGGKIICKFESINRSNNVGQITIVELMAVK
mgnify:CR=1 FL=1